MAPSTRALIEKIQTRPSEQISEVEDFIVVRAQDRALSDAASHASAASFAEVWNNPEDDVHDAL